MSADDRLTNSPQTAMIDGNEAVGSVAYRTHEVIAIYPITPASPMGEHADAWSAQGRTNIWGQVPDVTEMQSEGGAAGAVHGALQAGALTTSFTASQGLLLMIPNLYKIAGELTPFVLHVAARTLATHALSIFGDHSDVMAVRQTGVALLASNTVQEAHDLALIAQMATLASRIPFVHFFDGFRTSHEIAKVSLLADATLRELLDEEQIEQHRRRALTPDRPVLRGTAQNPDVFFQAREACNPYYQACPQLVQEAMDRFAAATGRAYQLFDYTGDPEAKRVLVLMGSGVETARETADWLRAQGQEVGVLAVRLYRPFAVEAFLEALPPSVEAIAVLDRTKEPGAIGEPLYLDVVAAVDRRRRTSGLDPMVLGGRFGLSSKEFDPACVVAVFEALREATPHREFTVGIVDDVSHLSLPIERPLDLEPAERTRAIFYGLGSDGTVSANKNTIKIIGEETDLHAQGYFVYDSKKAGAVTVSHLRFGTDPIRSTYLIQQAGFVACHQWEFLERLDLLERAAPAGTFLLNSPYPPERVWDHLPKEVQAAILDKKLSFYVIDAYAVARDAGLGVRINTIMQTCFFALSATLPQEQAVAAIKGAIERSYGKRGPTLVERNHRAVDQALAHLHPVELPDRVTAERGRPPIVPDEAPDFVQRVTAVILAQQGDLLPVSAFPPDGSWPTGTAQWEKRAIASEVPLWEPDICIQCNQCVLACPHAAIRAKVYEPAALDGAPEEFPSTAYRAPDLRGLQYTLQVAPEDCTGCRLCVEVCPAKDKASPRRKAINMKPLAPVRARERENYRFLLDLPEISRERIQRVDAKGSQFFQPLFEYSGACAGCGETPYLKLLTQLFGDRLLIANATGCSSIYGGNLPTTPYTTNADGRGPAWSNSLFEDNAEFGFGMRLAVDSHQRHARELLRRLGDAIDPELVAKTLELEPQTETEIETQRVHVGQLRTRLAEIDHPDARQLEQLADYLVPKSIWLVGGDGWAYDIGYGGLDHVLASHRDVNVLVLDTEVYSNTGGQMSKATPLGAAAKFAFAGKETAKKDLGMEMMSYGHVFVAQIAFGAKMNQTVETLLAAESFPGPSLVIAYSPCIAHGYDLAENVEQQKRLVASGIWPLYRFDPRRVAENKPPLHLDSGPPRIKAQEVLERETRYRMVEKLDPVRYRQLTARRQLQTDERFSIYQQLAGITVGGDDETSNRDR